MIDALKPKQDRQREVPFTGKSSEEVFWVGIGASAGGLEAIRSFAREISADHSVIYIIAQHMAPHHKSLLTEIINRETDLDVREITNQLTPTSGCIYITPPNHDVVIEGGVIFINRLDRQHASPKPSVDVMLSSLAKDQKDQAIGVIFSGTGSDGAKGMIDIHKHGGLCIAQDEHTSKYLGMPQAAFETGVVDLVISPEELGAQFELLLKRPRDLSSLAPKPINSDGLAELNELLYQQTRVDFSDYKLGTVQRRIDRRMAAIGAENLSDYIDTARRSPLEVNELFKDLLITVTSFFRDPGEFEGLKTHINRMVAEDPGTIRRIWIAGVATGEEAYTIAMLFAEAFGGLRKLANAQFQIFATDIDEEAIEIARKGYYGETSLVAVPDEFIKQYFDPAPGGFTIRKLLREKLVFSVHNVATDPPFLSLDLVSCRNLLIYFQSSLQATVFERFHFSLKDNGLLFLGKSEAVVASQSLFKPALPEKHLFLQRPGFKRRIRKQSNVIPANVARKKLVGQSIAKDVNAEVVTKQLETLISALGPNAVIVDDNLNIVNVYGELDYFSGLTPGVTPTPSISSLVKKPWSRDIQVAVPGVFRKRVMYDGLTRQDPNDERLMSRVQVFPLGDGKQAEKLALITFKLWRSENLQASGGALSDENKKITLEQTIEELTRELDISKTNLQTTVEELESTNEELQALVEELQSSNEELQSTNEELETSNEELQSSNEELSTVNEELQVSSGQLNAVNQSLLSVLENVYTPMLVVDKNLNIINASQSAIDLFQVDLMIGEPSVVHCSLPAGLPDIAPMILTAFASREEARHEIMGESMSMSLSVTPFYNVTDDILGAIVQLVDNTMTVARVQDEYNALLDCMPFYVLETDVRGEIHQINQNFCKALGLEKSVAMGENYFDLLHSEYREEYAAKVRVVIDDHKPVVGMEENLRFADGKEMDLRISLIPICADGGLTKGNAGYRVLTIAELTNH